MKRYHHRRVRTAWIQLEIPRMMGMQEALTWCRDHLGARFHMDRYSRTLWFERRQDADAFERKMVWEILRS